MRHTNAHCWIRIPGLEQEYWRPEILTAIAAGSAGISICRDDIISKSPLDKFVGNFAQILIGIQLCLLCGY